MAPFSGGVPLSPSTDDPPAGPGSGSGVEVTGVDGPDGPRRGCRRHPQSLAGRWAASAGAAHRRKRNQAPHHRCTHIAKDAT